MIDHKDLLIEIGTEELPPKALLMLSAAFQKEVTAGLKKEGLNFTDVQVFATPRRLALIVSSLKLQQDSIVIEKFGPAIQAAYDSEGQPTKAAEGFARSCGVHLADLQERSDGKVNKLFFSSSQDGQLTSALIPHIVNTALSLLPIPKRMRWGSSRVEFVRPVHWVVLLFGEDLIPASILGVETDTYTYGHRFHYPDKIQLHSPSDYAQKLSAIGFVIPDFSSRRQQIHSMILDQANRLQATAMIDDDLLDEVTALVEWPVALTGKFDPKYLAVPSEALISSLKEHQKCFHLVDADNNILPAFITISNIQSTKPDVVVDGNEKVIGPRLADAAFFFDQDKLQPLSALCTDLKSVIFQHKLGTLFDKSSRVDSLSRFISESLHFDPAPCSRAAQLAKCDLLTRMVGEFPDLQGVMGRYYALHDGESTEVATAIEEQYLPRFSGDNIPSTDTGITLALAERFDTLVGLFAIGQPPTGSKDPFALRRSALGILRIILENKLDLDLSLVITHSISTYSEFTCADDLNTTVLDFIFDRFRAWYLDKGISAVTFLSVASIIPTNPLDFDLRINAVSSFSLLPQAEALAAANKRVANILSKLEHIPQGAVQPELLVEPAEVDLANQLNKLIDTVQPMLVTKDYTGALNSLSSLHDPIYTFFDSVMVNTDDIALRTNRLTLLQQLRQLFLKVADISQL